MIIDNKSSANLWFFNTSELLSLFIVCSCFSDILKHVYGGEIDIEPQIIMTIIKSLYAIDPGEVSSFSSQQCYFIYVQCYASMINCVLIAIFKMFKIFTFNSAISWRKGTKGNRIFYGTYWTILYFPTPHLPSPEWSFHCKEAWNISINRIHDAVWRSQ